MKKTIIAAGFLAASLAAHAESLRVHVPFAFSATGTRLPAGDYSISMVRGTSPILLIEGSGMQAFVFGRVVGDKLPMTPAVVFQQEALVGVTAAGHTFELSSGAERRGSIRLGLHRPAR